MKTIKALSWSSFFFAIGAALLMVSPGAVGPLAQAATEETAEAVDSQSTVQSAETAESTSYDAVMTSLVDDSPPPLARLLSAADRQIRAVLPGSLLAQFSTSFLRSQQYLGDPQEADETTLQEKVASWLSAFRLVSLGQQPAGRLTTPFGSLVAPLPGLGGNQSNIVGNDTDNNTGNGTGNATGVQGNQSSDFSQYWADYTKATTIWGLLGASNYYQWSMRAKLMFLGMTVVEVLLFLWLGKHFRTTTHRDRTMAFTYLMAGTLLALEALVASYVVMGTTAYVSLCDQEVDLVVCVMDATTKERLSNLEGSVCAFSCDARDANASMEQFTYLLGCDGEICHGYYSLQCRERAEGQPNSLKAPPPPGVWCLTINTSGYRGYTLSRTTPIPAQGSFIGTVLLRQAT